MQLLTAKQCVVLANLSQEDYMRKKNKWLSAIKLWLQEHAANDVLIPMSCVFESALSALSPEERCVRCVCARACACACCMYVCMYVRMYACKYLHTHTHTHTHTCRLAYCKEHKVESVMPKVVRAGLKALNMQCYFTAGADEVTPPSEQVHSLLTCTYTCTCTFKF
jgi:ribosome-binding ATPase YchF (GTP1/OBG family)